jgi:hypothetical protein
MTGGAVYRRRRGPDVSGALQLPGIEVAERANNRRETVESNPLGAMISFCGFWSGESADAVAFAVDLAGKRRREVVRESSARF